MKTKKTTLFTALAFALLMSLGTTMCAHIDDPIVDPDLLDRPRVSSQTVNNGLPGEIAAEAPQQDDQITVVLRNAQ